MQAPPLLTFRFAGILHDLPNNPQQLSYAFAKAHPGEVYFPWNPLSTLLAENTPYHFAYGLLDRQLAEMPVSPDYFYAYMPAHLKWVAVSKGNEYGMEIAQAYLPNFSHPVDLPELPGWTVLEKQ